MESLVSFTGHSEVKNQCHANMFESLLYSDHSCCTTDAACPVERKNEFFTKSEIILLTKQDVGFVLFNYYLRSVILTEIPGK